MTLSSVGNPPFLKTMFAYYFQFNYICESDNDI